MSNRNDTLAMALYEQQGRRNKAAGEMSFYPAPWEELPQGSRDYWRGQATELSEILLGLVRAARDRR